ncbi:aminoglycoside phosphotransferase family protein [Rhodoferax aquaticus]|uniref:Aminoglycoside phosphotransferase n=1 Tax=Rhodoferax aquaticus TaxID=2527691 RepID=A0A515EW74_9BURK|nr:phosphotransferase [Rhodoferax aquaticus]QDL56896.1 aminoglycoside phosphotransferase [Rhodoferax aquaticus]
MTSTPLQSSDSSYQLRPGIEWSSPERQQAFSAWFASVKTQYQLAEETLHLASADASFRRYLRVTSPTTSFVIMDAPPDKENCHAFVKVAKLLQGALVKVPEILAWDELDGFMLLSDLGAQTFAQSMENSATPSLDGYLEAVDMLIRWQLASVPGVLPVYDEAFVRRELELFPQWYIGEYRKCDIDKSMRKTLDDAFQHIQANTLAWPSVFMHRDFMPRNLMVPGHASPLASTRGPLGLGLLDFQDAVYGPITYDIASLLRDAFLSWDESFCIDVTVRYWEKARKAGLPVGDDFGEFYRGVEWMGLQRHLKITGLFARLTLRDGKAKYLADTPRFIAYMRATCARYRELGPLLRLIERVEGIEVPSGYAFGRV